MLARLELDRHFEDVFDIVAGELEPKPSPAVYDRFLKAHGVDPARAAMFEDLARNLAVPHRLGMTTVLVVPENTREVFREDWELEGRDEPHVDHVTDDLVSFLETSHQRRRSAKKAACGTSRSSRSRSSAPASAASPSRRRCGSISSSR